MKVIILAGGSGTRLWPLSRANFPKQFLKLKNDRSLFQLTVERSCRLTALSQLYVVTNSAYKFLVLGQIEELGDQFAEGNVLLEPVGKNTLPAICYGVKEIVSRHGDDLVAVFPSDHLLEDGPDFFETVQKGRSLAAEYLLTFGVKPAKPHPGYGYIKPGEPLGAGYRAAEFKEKPDEQTALAYLEKGYLWNSGMFMLGQRSGGALKSRRGPPDRFPPDHLPPLGFLHHLRRGVFLQDQADHRAAGEKALLPASPPPKAEHWIVVRGTARVTVEGVETFGLKPREHLRAKRQAAPPGKPGEGCSGGDRGAA